MGLAQYQIIPQGDEWGILHDGDVKNTYATKEAAFEAAVAAASLAIREGHEVHVSVPDRSSSLLKNLEMESFLFLDDGVGVARWSL